MLQAYKASVSFIEEHKAALGPDHRTVASSVRTEILHLTKLFRSEELPTGGGRQSITELIKHMRADVSNTFSSEVRGSLIEAAIARLSGDTGDDVIATSHGAQKSQTHLAGHNYHVSADWDFFMDPDPTNSLKKKMTKMSMAWLQWGLRVPSAPTFRSGLSMLAVCCKIDLSPDQAHAHMLEFQKEFRKLRTLYPGDATLKVFPVDPSDFKSTHPEHIGDYVACRVDKAAIIELSHPKSIPCKTNNASLQTPKKSSSFSSSSSSTSLCDGSREGLLRGLLGMVLGEGGSCFSPEIMKTPPPRSARRVAPLALTDREPELAVDDLLSEPGTSHKRPAQPASERTPVAVVPPITDGREPISGEAESLLLPAGHDEPLAAVVPVDSVAEQTAKFIQNRKEKNAALKKKEKEKQIAAALKAAGVDVQPIRKRVHGKTSLVALLAKQTTTKVKKGKGPAKAKSKAKAKAKAKATKDAKPTAKPTVSRSR